MVMFTSMRWPPISANNDGFLFVLTKMALVKRFYRWHAGHIMHTYTQFVVEATWPMNLLERLSTCGEGTLGMGTISEGMSTREHL
jgi:hypothetical protein